MLLSKLVNYCAEPYHEFQGWGRRKSNRNQNDEWLQRWSCCIKYEGNIHKEQKQVRGSSNIREFHKGVKVQSLGVRKEKKQLVTQVGCRSCQSGEGCSQRLTEFSALQAHTHVLIVLVLSYHSKVHVRHVLALSLFLFLSLSLMP